MPSLVVHGCFTSAFRRQAFWLWFSSIPLSECLNLVYCIKICTCMFHCMSVAASDSCMHYSSNTIGARKMGHVGVLKFLQRMRVEAQKFTKFYFFPV